MSIRKNRLRLDISMWDEIEVKKKELQSKLAELTRQQNEISIGIIQRKQRRDKYAQKHA